MHQKGLLITRVFGNGMNIYFKFFAFFKIPLQFFIKKMKKWAGPTWHGAADPGSPVTLTHLERKKYGLKISPVNGADVELGNPWF